MCLFACAVSGMHLKREHLPDHFSTSAYKPLKNVEIFPEGLSVTSVKGKRCQPERDDKGQEIAVIWHHGFSGLLQ